MEALQEMKEEEIGYFSRDRINAIFERVLQPLKKNNLEIPSLYIVQRRGAFVGAANISFFNRIKKLNAIFISKSLFFILKEEEPSIHQKNED